MRDLLHRELAKVFRTRDLTSMQFAVLDILRRKGDLSVGEIRTGILSTQGNVPVVIKNLLKQGYIERLPRGDDKRFSIIHLTDKGATIASQIMPPYFDRLGELLAAFTPRDKRELSRLLRKFGERNGLTSN